VQITAVKIINKKKNRDLHLILLVYYAVASQQLSYSSYLVKWSQPSHLTSLPKLVLKCGSQQALRP